MIKTILFDIDGVILSEERCFDASSLAVWELLNSDLYLGLASQDFTPQPSEEMIRSIRDHVFNHNHVLEYIKSYGINSNWDIVYLTFSYQLIYLLSSIDSTHHDQVVSFLNSPIDRKALKRISNYIPSDAQASYTSFVHDFEQYVSSKQDLFNHLNRLIRDKLHIETTAFSRQNDLWHLGREVYQEWYVGDQFIEESIGKKAVQPYKKGFLQEEITLAPKEELLNLFNSVKTKGIVIGFSTGRPDIETYEPLKELGLLNLVNSNRVTTSSDVLRAEEVYQDLAPLGKPHPYTYLSSYYGKDISLSKILNQSLPLNNGKEILIVGDSVADGLAAQAMGAQFAAVLTGLTGEAAQSEFEALGADFILPHVRHILDLNLFD